MVDTHVFVLYVTPTNPSIIFCLETKLYHSRWHQGSHQKCFCRKSAKVFHSDRRGHLKIRDVAINCLKQRSQRQYICTTAGNNDNCLGGNVKPIRAAHALHLDHISNPIKYKHIVHICTIRLVKMVSVPRPVCHC